MKVYSKTKYIYFYEGEHIVESSEDDDNCRSTYIVLKKFIS